MPSSSANIDAARPETLIWNHTDPAASLNEVRKHVETEANKAIDWYWANKKWKARSSRAIQFLAVALAALAGILPIFAQILTSPDQPSILRSDLWASLFVGVAAALIALDRAFGLSTGWTRYIMTGTSIRKALQEFRMDWTALSAKSGSAPTSEQVVLLIQRAKDLMATVDGLVIQETKDWVTEFQNNISQLEKDLNAQIDRLKEEVKETNQAQATADLAGSIELTVTDADKLDAFQFRVVLRGTKGILADEKETNTKKWVYLNVPPGQYKVSVAAATSGKEVSAVVAAFVKPGEVSKQNVSFLS